MEDRKRKEREFHNARESVRMEDAGEAERSYPNLRFYSVVEGSRGYIFGWLAKHCAGKDVLDYCCGPGGMSVRLAKLGARKVTGIDISDVSIRSARQKAEAEGVSDRVELHVMDAEHTTFPDDTFDAAVCSGVLHHLDLDPAYRELARVLRPGGRIICIEAMRHNPYFMRYRRRTPDLRTAWEVDHILGVPEIRKARKYFDSVEVRFFHLFALGAVPLRRTPFFKPALAVLNLLDAAVLRIPGIRRWAWQAVFILSEPKPQTALPG
ncbi:MAG: type 11 methyltransferase [Gemmatimonadetes bacterium]|nr:type 11 methyltransferase [Gemmatimonadota bacterium]